MTKIPADRIDKSDPSVPLPQELCAVPHKPLIVYEPKSLVSKLLEVMAAVESVEKGGTNEKGGYKYVRVVDMITAVRPHLIRLKVLMTSDVTNESHWEKQVSSGGTQSYCQVLIAFTFYDAESGEKLGPFHGIGWGTDYGDKAPYKANTGALKYALRNAFLIPDETDTSDPEHEVNETKGKRTKTEKLNYENINGTVTKYQIQGPDTMWLEVGGVRLCVTDAQCYNKLKDCPGKRVELTCVWGKAGKKKIPVLFVTQVLGIYTEMPTSTYIQDPDLPPEGRAPKLAFPK